MIIGEKEAHNKMSCFINLLSQTKVSRNIGTEGNTTFWEKNTKSRTQESNKYYNEEREKLNSKADNLVAFLQCVQLHLSSIQNSNDLLEPNNILRYVF